jgi:hypothetical protein
MMWLGLYDESDGYFEEAVVIFKVWGIWLTGLTKIMNIFRIKLLLIGFLATSYPLVFAIDRQLIWGGKEWRGRTNMGAVVPLLEVWSATNLFKAQSHTRYCGLVRGPPMEK